MTLKEFAAMLDGRAYGHEITIYEEALAKELGFVVVFGYSDDNAELRGAIDDEIGCYDGGILEHKDLQGTILAQWCPDDVDCSWYFSSTQPSEKFYIYEDGELYCVGAVIDNNKPKPKTNADRIRAMSDEDLYKFCLSLTEDGWPFACKNKPECDPVPPQAHMCNECFMEWLKQPAQEEL